MRMVMQIITTVIIYALTLFLLATTVSAQPSTNPLFKRIYDGDYVWSREFPRKEASLVAYGFGLFNAIRSKCPNAISNAAVDDVQSFFANVAGTNQYGAQVSVVLLQAVSLTGEYVSLHKVAERDLLNSSPICDGAELNRVAQNVSRMLASKRPLYRSESAQKTTFLKEFIVPIDTYHHYPGIGGSLAGGTARRVFDRDVDELKEYGMTILECHYDENPNDEYHEEQYYWGPSLGAEIFSPIPIIWLNFLESSQMRMDREMGSAGRGKGRVIHPFTTYGSPRSECPSIRDPGLAMARIEKPKTIEWPKGKCRPVGNGQFECP